MLKTNISGHKKEPYQPTLPLHVRFIGSRIDANFIAVACLRCDLLLQNRNDMLKLVAVLAQFLFESLDVELLSETRNKDVEVGISRLKAGF